MRSASSADSNGSSRDHSSSCARMSTRNLTPSGKPLNWVSRRIRPGSSAARSARSASPRDTGSAAWWKTSTARSTVARSTSKSRASTLRKFRRPVESSPRYVRPSSAARARALTSPPRPSRQACIWMRSRSASSRGRWGRGVAPTASREKAAISRHAERRFSIVRSNSDGADCSSTGVGSWVMALILKDCVPRGSRVNRRRATHLHGTVMHGLATSRAAPLAENSAMSSAIRPGPNRVAASPCSQAAAAAASKAGIPCAISPRANPGQHIAGPAVASHGGALPLMMAWPSGRAMTVSAPFSSTTAPARAGGGAGLRQFVTVDAEQPLELPGMRRQEAPLRQTAGKARPGVRRTP